MAESEYLLRLFIAGDEPNSRLAERNLRGLCTDCLPGRHRIEVVDVLQDFEAALAAKIMVAPAMVMLAPYHVTLYGTLADKVKVLAAFGLEDPGHGP